MDYKASLPHTTSLQVEGAFNFRSVGGYRSTIFPGAVIREGLIYRTGHLANVTEAGWLTIKRLGVSTIINLTSPGEVEMFTGAAEKTALPSGITTLHLPVKRGVFSMANQVSKYQIYRNKGLEIIAEGYLSLLEVGAPVIQRVLSHFLENPSGSLIHCAMGKDRTGVVVALLLSLAGVPHETIAEDFSLSEAYLDHLQARIADIVQSIDPNEKDPLGIARMATECRRDVMALTLQRVDERYGGVSQYVRDHCSLSAEDVDRIRTNMLCQAL